MSAFIAIVCKNEVKPLSQEEFSGFLPGHWVGKNEYTASCGSILYTWDFGVAFERPVVSGNDGLTKVQGYGADLEERFSAKVESGEVLTVEGFPEAFCAIHIKHDVLYFGTSYSGVDPLFYIETNDFFAVSNRHNLLGPFMADPTIDKYALASILGRGHINDFVTYWKEIKRARPGWLYTFDGVGVDIVPYYYAVKDTIGPKEVSEELGSIRTDINKALYVNSDFNYRLWLSGGKDSRAILGYLDPVIVQSCEIHTRGELYSPDVMAAIDVVNKIDLKDKHQVNVPSRRSGSMDVYRRLSLDLYWCFIGSSMHDLKAPGQQKNLLVIGGHENGFKSKPNKLNLASYLSRRKGHVNRFNLLTEDYESLLFDRYRAELEKVLERVPPTKYPAVESVVFRNSNYLSSALSISHIMTSEFHPFLDGRFFGLLMKAGDEVLSSQFIHYEMMRFHGDELASLPFADDSWPKELFGMEGVVEFRQEVPYEFNEAFPVEKSFGVFPWRLELVRLSREFVLRTLKDSAQFFDFVDHDHVVRLSSKDIDSFSLSDIICWLSLLKVCLIYKLGPLILSYENIGVVSEKIRIFFNEGVCNADMEAFSSTSDAQLVKNLDLKNAELSNAISEMVRQSRNRFSSVDELVVADILFDLIREGHIDSGVASKIYSKLLENSATFEVVESGLSGKVCFDDLIYCLGGKSRYVLYFDEETNQDHKVQFEGSKVPWSASLSSHFFYVHSSLAGRLDLSGIRLPGRIKRSFIKHWNGENGDLLIVRFH